MEFPNTNSDFKPTIFRLDDGSNECYVMGSEISEYMGLARGMVYKKFPKLWRRAATYEERQQLSKFARPNQRISSNTILLKAKDVLQIVNGKNSEYSPIFYSIINGKPKIKPTKEVDVSISSLKLPTEIKFDECIDKTISLNDFNIFTFPICNLSMPRNLSVRPVNATLQYYNTLNWRFDFDTKKKLIETVEDQVPIRLYIKIGNKILNDLFFWNKNEFLLDYETFAILLCMDYDLPEKDFVNPIIQSMSKQLYSYEETCQFEKLKNNFDTDSIPVLIKTDIQIGEIRYQDQFEWDLNYSDESLPTEFSKITISDLNLPTDFIIPLAVCIVGQIKWYKRHYALFNTESSLRSCTQNTDLSENVLRKRGNIERWTPKISLVTEKQIKQMAEEVEDEFLRVERCISLLHKD